MKKKTKLTPAEFLQPAIKFTDYAATPQQFMQLLNNAKIVYHGKPHKTK